LIVAAISFMHSQAGQSKPGFAVPGRLKSKQFILKQKEAEAKLLSKIWSKQVILKQDYLLEILSLCYRMAG